MRKFYEQYAKDQNWYKPNVKHDGQRVQTWRDLAKLTWHHLENSFKGLLVPSDINNDVAHSGGRSTAKTGTTGTGGVRGGGGLGIYPTIDDGSSSMRRRR